MVSVYPRLQKSLDKPAKPAKPAQTERLEVTLSPLGSDRTLLNFKRSHNSDLRAVYHLERRTFL